jgi:hypothetical protein
MTSFRGHVSFAIALTFWLGLSNAADQRDDDWYHPGPPSDKDTPLRLPVTTARPVVPVAVGILSKAISELSKNGIVQLTADRWAELRIPLSADELRSRIIEREQRRFSGFAEEISHWRSLKDQALKPYLVRAVASEGDASEFSADVWHDVLMITHFSVVEGDLANDPLRQHAAILFNPPDVRPIKSPVIVYLEREPKFVFTNIQIVKAGR